MDEHDNNAPLSPAETDRTALDDVPSPAASTSTSQPTVTRTPYTRRRATRRTVEAIDDLSDDDAAATYTHESEISVGGMVQDGSYRRARSQISQFQKGNRYGQYLEVPKGRRSIFAKRERRRRRRSALAALLVVALLAAVAYVVWQIMSNLSFGSFLLGG